MSEYMEYNWMSNAVASSVNTGLSSGVENKDSCIQKLRTSLQSLGSFVFQYSVDLSDKNLSKFLNATDFNVEESLQLVQRYYLHRNENSVFHEFSVEADDIKDCLHNCLPGILPSKDRKGRSVLLISASNWDCTYSLVSIYRTIIFCLEYLIGDIHNQANGFVFIVDWTEFPFRRSMNLRPTILKMMVNGLQNCFPAKYKGIHFVNQPWYVEAVLTCIKPFLKTGIANNIHFHGNNLSTLHEHVHKDILPTELGGEQPSFSPQNWLGFLSTKSC